MPTASTSTRTWPLRGAGSGTSLWSRTSGPPLRSKTTACIKWLLLLLDQTGRTGLVFRHSTARLAVVAAAATSAPFSSDVGDDHAHPFERAVRPSEQIASKAGRRRTDSSCRTQSSILLQGNYRGCPQAGFTPAVPGVPSPIAAKA